MRLARWLIIFQILAGSVNIRTTKAEDKNNQQGVICDNGLSDWLQSDSDFGQWVAKSIRIIQLGRKKYQPQFKDCNDKKAEWIPLFEGDIAYDDLKLAQHKVKRGFETKKEICDAVQHALK